MRIGLYQKVSLALVLAMCAVVMVRSQGRGGNAAPAPPPTVTQISGRPAVDPAAHDRGRTLWATHCIDCHGAQARGSDTGPNIIRTKTVNFDRSAAVAGSVLGPNVRVHSFCTIENSILMPGVRVGRHARIRNAIVDRDVFVPRGAWIGYDAAEDAARHTVSERGVVVVTDEDHPYIGPFDDEALRLEAEVDRHNTDG